MPPCQHSQGFPPKHSKHRGGGGQNASDPCRFGRKTQLHKHVDFWSTGQGPGPSSPARSSPTAAPCASSAASTCACRAACCCCRSACASPAQRSSATAAAVRCPSEESAEPQIHLAALHLHMGGGGTSLGPKIQLFEKPAHTRQTRNSQKAFSRARLTPSPITGTPSPQTHPPTLSSK